MWEAEECYVVAFESFYGAHASRNSMLSNTKEFAGRKSSGGNRSSNHHESLNRCDMAWGMAGVSAGQKLWCRLAGLCQSAKPRDLIAVMGFKCGRKPLRSVLKD